MIDLPLILKLFSGLAWTAAYIALIHRGLRDKTYGMPFAALALNLAWEGLYAWQGFQAPEVTAQTWINLVWFVFDLGLLGTWLAWGREDFQAPGTRGWFWPWTLVILGGAVGLQLAFLAQFGDKAAWYSAFLQNLYMSGAFLSLFLRRGSLKGQSPFIAAAKLVGTLAPTILFGLIYGNLVCLAAGIGCLILDTAYLALLLVPRPAKPEGQA